MARMSNAHVGGLRWAWPRRRSRRTTCSENCKLQAWQFMTLFRCESSAPDACMYAMIWTAMRYVKHQFWRLRLRDAHAQKHLPVACPQMSASLGISGILTILLCTGWQLMMVKWVDTYQVWALQCNNLFCSAYIGKISASTRSYLRCEGTRSFL